MVRVAPFLALEMDVDSPMNGGCKTIASVGLINAGGLIGSLCSSFVGVGAGGDGRASCDEEAALARAGGRGERACA